MLRTWSIIFLLVIITFNLTYSQVVIKEKVKLKSQTNNTTANTNLTQTNRGYTPCGPYLPNSASDHYWQVVWAGYYGSLDPQQQLFGPQGNVSFRNIVNTGDGPYDIHILEGASRCSLQKRVVSNDYGTIYIHMKDTATTELNGISGSDLIGSGDYMNFDCVPSYLEQVYQIKYNYLDIGQNEDTVVYSIHSTHLGKTIFLHTLIVKQSFVFFDKETYLPFAEDEQVSTEAKGAFCTSLDTSSWYEDYPCKGPWIYSKEGGFPSNVKLNVTIPQGQEYGDIFYYDTLGNKIEGKYFNNMDYYNYSRLRFEATGIEPIDTSRVKIHISPTDPSIPGADSYVYVTSTNTYPIKVTLQPDTLSPGDTASIILERKLSGYPATYEQFSSDQLFDVKIDVGSKYGTILNTTANDTADVFNNIEQGFKFIAAKNIDTSEAKISIRVHAIVNTGIIVGSIKGDKDGSDVGKQLYKVRKNIAVEKIASLNKIQKKLIKRNGNKKTESKVSNLHPIIESTNPWGIEDIIGIGKAVIKYHTILLGESKYYQAKFNYTIQKMEIEEIKPDENGVPHQKSGMDGDCEWITSENEWEGFDVWGDNPVEILEGDNMGVYWERQKPIWGTDKILDPGLIRLVGRYWKENQSYIVKLTTNGEPKNWDLESSIKIKVIKPSKIGEENSQYNDVFGNVVDLNKIIIEKAGKFGIPPQIIKAQMLKEGLLSPAYRYEPFPDAHGIHFDSRYTRNRFKITDSGNLGTPSIPSTHTNINPPNERPNNYWGYQGTIWDLFFNHSSTLNPLVSGEGDLYPMINSKGKKLWYRDGEKGWTNKYTEYYAKNASAGPNNAGQIARQNANNWLRYKYQGGIMDKGIAQTRMSSSYGFLQITYFYARENLDYIENDDNYPEKLNETEWGINYSLNALLKYIEDRLHMDFNSINWIDGFENIYRDGLTNYNGGNDIKYGIRIIDKARKYHLYK